MAGSASGTTSGQSSTGGSGSTGASSSSGSTSGEASTEVASSTTPPLIPGLYGNQYELQVDVSRLPRIDQYEQFLDPNSQVLPDRVSDVKTIAYYVPVGADGRGTGLVRREMDRAASRYAADQGGSEPQLHEELIAPEVTAVEFSYYDGSEWLTEWDSSVSKGLPIAVGITLSFAPLPGSAAAASMPASTSLSPSSPGLSATTGISQPGYPVYRLLVHIPSGKGASEEPAAETTESTDPASTSTSGSSTSGTSGSSGSSSSSGSGR